MLKLLSFYNHESSMLAWQLSFRRYLNNASADSKKSGQQNVFYFEESNLLPANKTCSLYSKLYKEIPVVAVLGWAGAQDQNVQKYSQIYASLGYHTIRFSPSHSLTFLDTKKHTTYAAEFLELFKTKHNLTENKIFLHMFSNASFFIVYHHLIGSGLICNEENDFFRKNQVGVIYDSALGMPANNLQFIHAVADLVGKKNSLIKRYMMAIVLAAVYKIYLIIFRNNYFSNAFKDYIERDASQLPTLHIYSKADKLIPHENISKLIRLKKSAYPHMRIDEVVYTDAEHVLIYAKYPEKYLNHIGQHLRLCNLDLNKLKQDIK